MTVQKILLFDIDGTLLHTGGVGALALNQVFREMFGVENAWSEMVPDGKTDLRILEELSSSCLGRPLSERESALVAERYHEIFEKNIYAAENFRLMPGVTLLLKELFLREDLALGIATGNFEKAAWLKLRRGNLDTYFHFGGFGSDSASREELTRKAAERGFQKIGRVLEAQDIWVIGDTQHDILAGKSLGAKTAGVATGRLRAEDFRALGADVIFEDLSCSEFFFKELGLNGAN